MQANEKDTQDLRIVYILRKTQVDWAEPREQRAPVGGIPWTVSTQCWVTQTLLCHNFPPFRNGEY